MQLSKLRFSMTVVCIFLLAVLSGTAEAGSDSVLFREYIGSDFKQVKFSDVPIHSDIDFHFILSFAIDYTTEFKSPSPTDGKFNIFWDTDNLSPSEVHQIKNNNRNVKVALSLGGDSVGDGKVYFTPDSIDSWVKNAVSTLTEIIEEFDLDGIDIDYEHFHSDPNTFAECIGQLVTILKKKRLISFASMAPFDDEEVQSHYQALWKKYGSVFDFVNFQFYAYDEGTSVQEFLEFFDQQTSNYEGGKILVSVISDQSGGLIPDHGFFTACKMLQKLGKLEGIFIWSADDSKEIGFRFEKQSQALLARSH